MTQEKPRVIIMNDDLKSACFDKVLNLPFIKQVFARYHDEVDLISGCNTCFTFATRHALSNEPLVREAGLALLDFLLNFYTDTKLRGSFEERVAQCEDSLQKWYDDNLSNIAELDQILNKFGVKQLHDKKALGRAIEDNYLETNTDYIDLVEVFLRKISEAALANPMITNDPLTIYKNILSSTDQYHTAYDALKKILDNVFDAWVNIDETNPDTRPVLAMLAPYRIEAPVDLEQDLSGFEEELTAPIIDDESGMSHSPNTELITPLPIEDE